MSSFYQKLTAEGDSSLLLRVSSLQSDAAMFHSGQDCGFRVSKAAHSLFFWIDLYFSHSLVSLTFWARYPKCFDASFVHEKADFLKSRIKESQESHSTRLLECCLAVIKWLRT